MRSCPKTTFDKCRQSRRLWGGMKNELPIKRHRGRLALAETTRICTRGFFRRSTPAETRPAWKCRQNHNYAVYGDTSQNIRVLNQTRETSLSQKGLPFQMFRNNLYGKFSTEKDPQKSRAQSCFPTGYGSLRAASKQKSSQSGFSCVNKRGLGLTSLSRDKLFFVTFTAVL